MSRAFLYFDFTVNSCNEYDFMHRKFHQDCCLNMFSFGLQVFMRVTLGI